jgi:hypothetical protein
MSGLGIRYDRRCIANLFGEQRQALHDKPPEIPEVRPAESIGKACFQSAMRRYYQVLVIDKIEGNFRAHQTFIGIPNWEYQFATFSPIPKS